MEVHLVERDAVALHHDTVDIRELCVVDMRPEERSVHIEPDRLELPRHASAIAGNVYKSRLIELREQWRNGAGRGDVHYENLHQVVEVRYENLHQVVEVRYENLHRPDIFLNLREGSVSILMKRKITDRLLEWKHRHEKKALLVQGARQIGKTYSIRDFVKNNYVSHVYFNLESNENIRGIFESSDRTADHLLEAMSFYSGTKLIPGASAIILDEIQACLPAYSSLKALAEIGRFDIIASGSLMGVKIDDLQNLSPMGYVDSFRMYPMDFEEFLWANGLNEEQTGYIRSCVSTLTPMDKAILTRIDDLYRRYMVVGGMPDAVKTYVSSKDYTQVKRSLDRITDVIRTDVERCSKGSNRLKVSSCFDSIPLQLANGNGKFRYVAIEKRKNSGARMYASAVQWLISAGIAEPCCNVSDPTIPLKERMIPEAYKLYMFDTGVLINIMEPGVAAEIVNRDPYANNGAVLENCTACALRNLGYQLLYYERRNSTLEIDFIYNDGGELALMEVKSGRNKRAKSLRTLFLSERKAKKAIKLSQGNIAVDPDGIVHYPLFAPFFFVDASEQNIFSGDDTAGLMDDFERVLGKDGS